MSGRRANQHAAETDANAGVGVNAAAMCRGSRPRARAGLALVLVSLVAALVLSGCGAYGGEKVTSAEGTLEVLSDGEHCLIYLPAGWTWLPAQWMARSENGSSMAFSQALYGRPMYADWSEARQQMIDTARERSPEADIDEGADRILIDYGSEGGLALLQRFDRVGCQLTFTGRPDARAADFDDWQAIIDSLRRHSPTPGFTPTAD